MVIDFENKAKQFRFDLLDPNLGVDFEEGTMYLKHLQS